MKLVLIGVAEFDPFGISFLKHNSKVSQTIDLGAIEAGKTITLLTNVLTLGVNLVDNGGVIEADIKVAIYGFPVLDSQLPINSHIAAGPQKVEVGGPQLGFTGTVQVIDDTVAPAMALSQTTTGSAALNGTNAVIASPPVAVNQP